jgi:streptogramin lyase
MLSVSYWAIAFVLAQSPVIESMAGTDQVGDSGDGGPARDARLNSPFGVVFDVSGNLFVADTFNHRVRRIDSKTGLISTVAGQGRKGFEGDGNLATEALLNEPYGLAIDRDGDLFIADRLNHRIRRVDGRTGVIATIAGPDSDVSQALGTAAAKLNLIDAGGIALDGSAHLLIADVGAHRVWSLDVSSSALKLLAGTGRREFSGDDGPAAAASLMGPRAVAVARDGTIVIVEREGNRLRSIDPKTGRISTIAGTGKKGYTGDGGPAQHATFNGPKELAIAANGDILVVDTENHAVRRIDVKNGRIATLAGNGQAGGDGDGGPAGGARLNRPHGVAVAPDSAIAIGDTNNHRVRKVATK